MDTYSVNTSEQPVAAVAQLATDVVDAIHGYETMVEKAEDDLRPAVERLLALHQSHAPDLMQMVGALGGQPEDAGSAMSAVHRAVAAARDFFGALDASAAGQIADGEERIVQSYSTAMSHMGDQPKMRQTLADQRDALRAEITRLRA